MHSMVAAFSPYTVKRRRVEIVRGYCCRFLQCSFPCGIVMLVLSILFILAGSIQLIYIIHFNGCNTISTSDYEFDEDSSISSPLTSLPSAWNCNRQTMKVLGITFTVTGAVLFFIGVLVTKYSRLSEENNVIRTPASSLIPNHPKTSVTSHHHPHYPTSHYYRTPSGSLNDTNTIVVSIR
ncbi:unnamed protein product [Adineta ricciae]|uniref:Uncharacterized protein n=1 Tax=Adineta ricciae TaxID=249248 RepID=A0A815L616_ADIRI|nr:unnamed protein product [Adineta ricciae]CAF1404788.1 unnamed protein product [Adineta ricciae]